MEVQNLTCSHSAASACFRRLGLVAIFLFAYEAAFDQQPRSITGQSSGDFIRTIRLRKAAALMTRSDLSLTDIMYTVGIQTQSYFSKAFKNEFGKSPTQYLKELERK